MSFQHVKSMGSSGAHDIGAITRIWYKIYAVENVKSVGSKPTLSAMCSCICINTPHNEEIITNATKRLFNASKAQNECSIVTTAFSETETASDQMKSLCVCLK